MIVDVLYVFFYDMDIYVNYSIEIFVFIRKGEGIVMLDFVLLDIFGKFMRNFDNDFSEKRLRD